MTIEYIIDQTKRIMIKSHGNIQPVDQKGLVFIRVWTTGWIVQPLKDCNKFILFNGYWIKKRTNI